jgi:predicted phosphodiesterase
MKYAILSDVHSNWEALTAVIEDAQQHGADQFLCLGDTVGYNADPALCLDKIKEIATVTICGNHDHYCSKVEHLDDFLPQFAGIIQWTREQLSNEQLAYLRQLRLVAFVSDFMLVHSNLYQPDLWEYVLRVEEAELHFAHQESALCFNGHTHVPLCFTKHKQVARSLYDVIKLKLGYKYLINVGSVGQPRDRDPRSSYVLYDQESQTVQLRRLNYDVREAQKKLLFAGLPEKLVVRLGLGQ